MSPKLKNGIALALLPQILLVKWLAGHPDWVEKYYSEGIYPLISRFLRMLFGWIPFSFGDLLYTALAIMAIRYLYLHWKSILKKPLLFLRNVFTVFSIVYFAFHLLWGLNYYRIPIEEKLGITTDYTPAALEAISDKLVQRANSLHMQITKDSTQSVSVPYSTGEIYNKTYLGYQQIKKEHPLLEYKTRSLKSSIYSIPLTYMGYGGYLNPFTNEAQVNAKVPLFRLPSISGHEVGHQIGYSAEDATNFIGFLVTSRNEDSYFQYASCTHALAYCLSELSVTDPETFDELYGSLNKGVRKNYQELVSFWQAYQNPFEPIFKSAFNAFLKVNNQEKGIESYNAVVGLLIGYDRKYGF
ncbi:DUF3810 domain-containing protein [Allomuricauda sp. SCSIO 65647]|uniref:DUF3810 domain-containing protein n=1 Tax=Allomuricauda sp. SCSIO 65647 TaxID=2908843 RepID=UPI001F194B86|nr:DUF3810 domain-containing protein [Muricauda sp. SCSIO 65647]UJH67904.1 DUF3810 domain-containing protein [Muricauda sp. SCSIO 65647]